jgi:hypothetical protein
MIAMRLKAFIAVAGQATAELSYGAPTVPSAT